MRLPSRAFVGVTVFGLITVLVTIPYTLLILSGYTPAPGAPHERIFPQDEDTVGLRIFLVLASLFSIAMVVVAWRTLLSAARQDARRVRRHRELKRQMREYREQQEGGKPPGFT